MLNQDNDLLGTLKQLAKSGDWAAISAKLNQPNVNISDAQYSISFIISLVKYALNDQRGEELLSTVVNMGYPVYCKQYNYGIVTDSLDYLINDYQTKNITENTEKLFNLLIKTLGEKAFLLLFIQELNCQRANDIGRAANDEQKEVIARKIKEIVQKVKLNLPQVFSLILNVDNIFYYPKQIVSNLILEIKILAVTNNINNDNLSPAINASSLKEGAGIKNIYGLIPDNIWRLFVDGNKQIEPEEMGFNGYEKREPACLQNMFIAFMHAIDSKDELSFEIYSKVHELSVKHLDICKNDRLREGYTEVGLLPNSNFSLMGFLELSSGENEKLYQVRSKLRNKTPAKKEQVELFIKKYNENMNIAETEIDKLKIIIELTSNLDRYHYYIDGNARTSMIILNRELIANGFCPTIMNDPNCLDGFSQTELLSEVINGMENYRHVIRTGNFPNGISTESAKSTANGKLPIEAANIPNVSKPSFRS